MDYLKKIINEAIEEILATQLPSKQDFDSDKLPVLYRVTFKDQLESIFKNGYDREFTGTKGGNLYGPGTYCTFDLPSTIENFKRSMEQIKSYGKSEYGDCIVKMKLIGGFDHFLILDERMAKQTYGDKWDLQNQLYYLFPYNVANNLYKTLLRVKEENSCGFMHGRTAPIAVYIWRNFGKDLYQKYKVRGLIYKGNRDGYCALPYDFSSIVPYSVSFDGGKTFQKRFNDDLYKRIETNADVDFEYGNKYDKITKPTNGYAAAYKDGKCNIIDVTTGEEISPIWFDSATNVDRNYEFKLIYSGIEFWACVEGVLDNRGNPWFTFDELPNIVEEIKTKRANKKGGK